MYSDDPIQSDDSLQSVALAKRHPPTPRSELRGSAATTQICDRYRPCASSNDAYL